MLRGVIADIDPDAELLATSLEDYPGVLASTFLDLADVAQLFEEQRRLGLTYPE